MAETTRNEPAQDAADLAAAARERGMEHLDSAKGQLAEGAERVAAAVDRTADELEGGGDNAISGFGHSVASVMRQLAGGLRERDVDEFARELGALARRNPGVFLAGCVALGFGIARFFKARAPGAYAERRDYAADRSYAADGSYAAGSSAAAWRSSGWRGDFDAEERLDLSEGATRRETNSDAGDDRGAASTGPSPDSDLNGTSPTQQSVARDDERNASKARGGGSKQKAKTQRASAGGSQQPGNDGTSAPSTERPPTDRVPGSSGSDSALTGGTGGGALRGGKS
jgi:hypothetical protein